VGRTTRCANHALLPAEAISIHQTRR
jgi:hypothetical protein